MYKIAALYRFVPLEDIPALKAALEESGRALCVCGTILIAPEGVNGTIAAAPDDLDAFLETLHGLTGIRDGEVKFSAAAKKPFKRFKIKHKREIITLKKPEADPNIRVGTYVSAQDWNALISDPETLVLDTRNAYETAVGTFRGALDPRIDIFTQFPDFVEKHLNPAKHSKVAMFCTGGIRCEKASAYMLAHGFEDVYHLKGGILKYLEDVAPDQSLWDGECFVFDERVSVGHGLKEGEIVTCRGCRHPLSEADTKLDSYEDGVSCRHCIETLTPEKRARLLMRHRQMTESGKAVS